MALMTVPLIVCASAAVDFSRISSARALLQASVDSAAESGAISWQISKQATAANTATGNFYSGTGAQLPNFVSTTAASISLYCSAAASSSGLCGSTGNGYSPIAGQAGCTGGDVEYCVLVTESATLHNSLFAYLIPSEVLKVTGVGIATSPNTPLAGDAVTSPSTGSAYDLNGTYISYVPLDSNGNPQYDAWNKPNSFCSKTTTSFGPMALMGQAPAGTATACNYLFLGDSAGSGGSGTLSNSNPDDPIAFTFVNDTGGTNSFSFANDFAYTSNIFILDVANNAVLNTSFGQNGYYNASATTPGPAPCNGTKCGFGICPENNLYGSISADEQGSGGNFVPSVDSIDVYYSGYELKGLPPTYNANHILTPFIGAPVAFNSSWRVLSSASGAAYLVEAVCPQLPTGKAQAQAESAVAAASGGSSAGAGFVPADTDISAANSAFTLYLMNPGYGTPSTTTVTVPANSIGLSATYYPEVNITANPDASFSTGYAPEISACTPDIYPVVPAGSTSPWWGWAVSNSGTTAGAGNCANAPVASLTSPNTPYQSGDFDNCALLIQPLGTNVPTTDADVTTSTGGPVLPDYYGEIVTSATGGTTLALDPIYDKPSSYADLMTGLTIPAEAAYYTPSAVSYTSITTGSFNGDFLKLEQPAQNSGGTHGKYVYSLPPETSWQCYNPGNNGKLVYGPIVHTPYDNAPYSDPTYGHTADQIQDAHEGVVYCGLNPGATFALYWNDMGGGQNDDLGYWNEITEFTCPAALNSNAGAGPAALSG